MMRLSFAAAAVTAGAIVSAAAQAAPIDLTNPLASATLAQILAQPGADQGKFVVFDKLFKINNFTPATGAPPAFSAANIVVTGRDNNVDGAGFRLFNQWADFPGDTTALGFVLDYDVSILPAYVALGYKITGVNLAFNGAAAEPGSVASVDESVFFGATFVNNSRVVAGGDGTSILSRMIPVPMTTSLNAVKDFKLFAPTANGFATASFIEQTFKQVPTPSGAALFLLGITGVARRRR